MAIHLSIQGLLGLKGTCVCMSFFKAAHRLRDEEKRANNKKEPTFEAPGKGNYG